MILSIIAILAGLYWLMVETNWLRVRLLTGDDDNVNLPYLLGLWAGLIASSDEILSMRYDLFVKNGRGPGVSGELANLYNPLVSWDWLKLHWHDMDGYVQHFDLDAYGVRHSMIIKKPEIIKDIMRACKPSRELKKQYNLLETEASIT